VRWTVWCLIGEVCWESYIPLLIARGTEFAESKMTLADSLLHHADHEEKDDMGR
jgi:hypothetical protein